MLTDEQTRLTFPGDPAARALLRRPDEALREAFPRLASLLERCAVAGKVEAQWIDLYRAAGPARAGLLLLGDAYQSVCPATGTGLSKVWTDVLAASERIPAWLAAGRAGPEQIAEYYADARKRACDEKSLGWAEYRRDVSTRSSLRWRLHRARHYLTLALRRPAAAGAGDGAM